MRETLRVLVDRNVAVNPEMPGPVVQVLAAGVDIEVAAGVADRATGASLEPGMLFRIRCLTGSSKSESRNQSAQRVRSVLESRRSRASV